MQTPQLLEEFIRFGLAALLGFLIGLEREMKAGEDTQTGLRDFVLYALLGAMSAYVAQQVESVWVIVVGFLAMAGMLMASFWAGFRRDREADVGITTEIAAFFTFFIGVLVAQGATEVSIALAIVVLAVLSKKRTLSEFRRHVEGYELEATLKLLVAAVTFFRSRRETVEATALKLDNPFSLGSALKFTLVFATTLMVTNLALHYLGDAWLPLVAIVSGLTDADAIAFSVSSAQQSGQISLDWAALNAVLGALSNTLMKLMLVLFLGHRGLFKQLLLAFIVIETVGLVTMFFYYDLSGVFF